MKKLNIAIAMAVGLALGLSGSAFANSFASGDVAGDSLITLPINASTVDTKTVDVWFIAATGATGYVLNMYGGANITAACNSAVTADITFSKQMVISASSLDCGEETTTSKPGDLATANLHLCKWTTPELGNGGYAIAINPIIAGTDPADGIVPENVSSVTNCSATLSDTGDGLLVEASSNAVTGTYHATVDHVNYQTFVVNVSGDAEITAKPGIPEPQLPAAGESLAGTTNGHVAKELVFDDISSDEQKASWYELWIYDKNNTRIEDYNDNPSFPNWFKIGVDSELICNATASGGRRCAITIDGAGATTIGAAATDDIFTWWVRGYNEKGISLWSSAPGTFKK